MENFKVTIQRFHETVNALESNYFIHVVTETDQVNYRADSEVEILNTETGVNVKLFVITDVAIPSKALTTPVVHTVNIGTFASDLVPEVNVEVVRKKEDGTKKTVGEEKLSSTDSGEDSRPIVMDSRFS